MLGEIRERQIKATEFVTLMRCYSELGLDVLLMSRDRGGGPRTEAKASARSGPGPTLKGNSEGYLETGKEPFYGCGDEGVWVIWRRLVADVEQIQNHGRDSVSRG